MKYKIQNIKLQDNEIERLLVKFEVEYNSNVKEIIFVHEKYMNDFENVELKEEIKKYAKETVLQMKYNTKNTENELNKYFELIGYIEC